MGIEIKKKKKFVHFFFLLLRVFDSFVTTLTSVLMFDNHQRLVLTKKNDWLKKIESKKKMKAFSCWNVVFYGLTKGEIIRCDFSWMKNASTKNSMNSVTTNIISKLTARQMEFVLKISYISILDAFQSRISFTTINALLPIFFFFFFFFIARHRWTCVRNTKNQHLLLSASVRNFSASWKNK